jgi:hypothetical protein
MLKTIKTIKTFKLIFKCILAAAALFIAHSAHGGDSPQRIFVTGVGKTEHEARIQAQLVANRQNFRVVSKDSQKNSAGLWVVVVQAEKRK